VLSGLTTLGAFGALSISSHLGIRSLGIMLTLSLVFLLASTLVVLPALLAWRARARNAHRARAVPSEARTPTDGDSGGIAS
jgi:predicted RND superfamily exporter protein